MAEQVLCMVSLRSYPPSRRLYWSRIRYAKAQSARRKTVSCFAFLLWFLYKQGSYVSLITREDQDALKFPKNLEDLRRLNAILSVYIDQHFTNVYVTYFITYV